MELNIFNEEHDILRKTLRDFIAKEVSPHIEEWNEAHATPRSIWQRLGELGCLGAYVPEEYGGYGSDFLTSVVLTEELVRSRCGGLSLDVSVSNDIAVPYLIEDGTEEQKKKYLPGCVTGDCIVAIAITEPNTGSDVAALRSTAVKDGDDYILNAQKTFITNGGHADLVVLAVKTDPKAKPAYAGVSLVLVEKGTAGFTVGRKLQKMGNPCSTTAELSFEDVRVPRAHLLGEEGSGFKSIMRKFQRERLVCAVMSLAYCELMLADTIQYTRERTAFGRSISAFQANKHKLVDMATEVEMSRCFVYHLSQLFNSGRQDIVKEISMAKFYVGELANRVAYECVQLHGGYGYVDEYWICRAYQDVRMLTIAAGTSEIMKEIIAKEMGV